MTHIVGKVYDLTQERFNQVLRELEATQALLAFAIRELQDISDHSVQPFHGQMWLNYVHDVSHDALITVYLRQREAL